MERMREKWTDERLDDLNHRVSEGFSRIDVELRELKSDLNSRFEATQHLILQVGGGIFATMAIGFIGLLIAQH